jgi:hypothetical protein
LLGAGFSREEHPMGTRERDEQARQERERQEREEQEQDQRTAPQTMQFDGDDEVSNNPVIINK